jgi:hypothetical protein
MVRRNSSGSRWATGVNVDASKAFVWIDKVPLPSSLRGPLPSRHRKLLAKRATDQLTPMPRQVNVETLLATVSAASDAVSAAVLPAPLVAFPIAEAGYDGRGWTTNWFGMLLLALGLVSVLSSSRVLRGAVLLRS